MKALIAVVVLAMSFCVSSVTIAQEELPPPPADWGELAQRLVENWGLEVCGEPTGGHPCINALNLIGIGRNSYDAIMGIEGGDDYPCNADGYDPDNWPPEEELTGEFMCKLKMVVWAAAFVGLIPYYEVPVSPGPENPLTPEEEEIAREVAGQAVTDCIITAQRDGVCDSGSGQTLCYICIGGGGAPRVCTWGPCP